MKSCYVQDIHKSTSMKVERGDNEGYKPWPSCTFCHYGIYSKQSLIHETLAWGK